MGALGVELGFDDLLKFDLHILKLRVAIPSPLGTE